MTTLLWCCLTLFNWTLKNTTLFQRWPTQCCFNVDLTLCKVIYKITENNFHLRILTESIQSQKRYLTSLDKINILPWKALVMSSQTVSCQLNSLRTNSLWNISYLSMPVTLTFDTRYSNILPRRFFTPSYYCLTWILKVEFRLL